MRPGITALVLCVLGAQTIFAAFLYAFFLPASFGGGVAPARVERDDLFNGRPMVLTGPASRRPATEPSHPAELTRRAHVRREWRDARVAPMRGGPPMNGALVLQLALDTLATAGIFAIVGMGVLVAYTGSRVLHLAHRRGGHGRGAGRRGLSTGWPVAVALVAGLAVAAVLSAAGERVLVAPVARRVELAAILLLTAGLVVRELLRGLYSRSAYSFPSVAGELRLGGGHAACRRPRHRRRGRGRRSGAHLDDQKHAGGRRAASHRRCAGQR